MRKSKYLIPLLAGGLFLNSNKLLAQEEAEEQSMDDILEMGLEDLLSLEVTSVSKKAENLQNVSVAMYVITNDMIQNSSATNLLELLMWNVPGFWAPQSEYNTAEANMRYSGSREATQGSILYLLDGTPMLEMMGSTFDFQTFDIPLDEIERVEVIKGSGGTIYGANSATGVVNIFTKNPDSYEDRVLTKVEGGNAGYFNFQLSNGKKINDKLSIGEYIKFRNFDKYDRDARLGQGQIVVPKSNGTGDTTITGRFNENYQKQIMVSAGLKADYKVSESTKLSLRTHLNSLNKGHYSATQNDVLYYRRFNSKRVIGSLRLDHDFSDNHSIFARFSHTGERDFYQLAGGLVADNSYQDIEIQDNLNIGKNSLSFGGNIRRVNFNVGSENDKGVISYADPNSSETLIGIFAQDKVSLLDDKLSLTFGAKAEQFTLVNDNFYFSPSFKFAFNPVEDVTIWGGFTQSYTTPGFNQTNIDFMLFRITQQEYQFGLVKPGVEQNFYQQGYQAAISAGATDSIANLQGQQVVQANADTINQISAAMASQYPGYFNRGVKNGTDTKPTRFQTFELGFRTSKIKNMIIEANAFYTIVTDAISASQNFVTTATPRITNPEERVDYFFYGNYIQGNSMGTEAVIKYIPVKGLQLEVSHASLLTEIEYQENNDFDVSQLSENQKDQTPSTQIVPKNIFRFKALVDLPLNFKVGLSSMYAVEYNSDDNFIFEEQRFENILGEDNKTVVAPNRDRFLLNLKVEKSFFDDNMSLYLYANDITNSGRTMVTNSIATPLFTQTTRMIGGGIKYQF